MDDAKRPLRGKLKRNLQLTGCEDKREIPAAAARKRPRHLTVLDQQSHVLRIVAMQFAKTGLHGTTTLMLARAAGISQRILYTRFGSKEHLFRKAVKNNIGTRLHSLEACPRGADCEGEAAAIQRIAEATVTACVVHEGNSILTNWALLEDPGYAADLYRDEIGSVELLWHREFAERFPDSRARRILSVHLVPYAVRACLAYGFWLATLRHDAKSTAALAQGFALGIAQAASALLAEQS
jgi:AcrR family transcriptional regulator